MDHTVFMSKMKKFLLVVISMKNQISLQAAKFAANPVQQAKANNNHTILKLIHYIRYLCKLLIQIMQAKSIFKQIKNDTVFNS